jgi:cytidine deaminase
MSSDLITAAATVRLQAYAPYSNFQVGAALLAKDGRVFCGCNVENLSYGLTVCAERNALFAAVSAGVREFECMAIVADTREPVSACGACRQVMAEFGDFKIISTTLDGRIFESTVGALLPRGKTGILNKE